MVFFGTSDGVMIVVTSSLATAILVIVTVLHRLYWSSLAKVPGPKLAAITSWYEIYYDVFKEGTYIWKIKEMHEQYGQCPSSSC